MRPKFRSSSLVGALVGVMALLVADQSANARDVWIGTAPFCAGEPHDCSRLGMNFVRKSRRGDGAQCVSGWKVLCRSRTPLPVAARRPFFLVAHKVNNLAGARDALQRGANAIEVDVRCSGPNEFYLRHDITEARTPLVPFLQELRSVAARIPGFALIIFDNKEVCRSEPGDVSHGVRLLNTIRSNFSNASGVRVLISTSNLSDAAIFVPLGTAGALRAGEGVAVDEENDFQAVSAFFRRASVRNFAYANGVCVACPGDGTVRRTVRGAIADRASLGFRLIYAWTFASENSMRDYLAMGVDGLFVNPSSIRTLRRVLRSFSATHRLATRADNPFP